jgi:hypothetical protein
MMSLKAFAPILADLFETTPAAIYERQRALIRMKALPTPIGRGRGNGLPATAETVAMLIIALMVTPNLSDTDQRVKRLANAKIDSSEVGRLSSSRDFKAALVAILDSDYLPDVVWSIHVSRTSSQAWIFSHSGSSGGNEVCKFGKTPLKESNFYVEAVLKGEVFKIIRAAIGPGRLGLHEELPLLQ